MSLRISGDALDPAEISRVLGCEPTFSQTKGEETHGRSGGVRIARTGSWRLEADPREPEDLDGQVAEIMGKLTPDLDIWTEITRHYSVDVFCGLFMASSNDGVELSPECLLALGQRGIKMGLDIYDADDSKVYVPPLPGEHTMLIREKPYFSYLDEKAFFTWLESLDDVVSVRGTPLGLCIDLRDKYLSKSGAYDLFGLFARYDYPVAPIGPFINPADDDYFRDPSARWYHEIYGDGAA